jgi:RNA polymerase-binding transcription factor DksA
MDENRREVLREILKVELQRVFRSLEGKPSKKELEDIELQLVEAVEDRLERIERAMRELEAGTYGACLGCKGEIDEKRLRALPFVKLCLVCDLKAEQTGVRAVATRNIRRKFVGPLFEDK